MLQTIPFLSESQVISGILTEVHSYGFNGMEKQNEHTSGNYDFGARILDTRLGRWMSVDDYNFSYADCAPYSFVNNMVLIAIDPDGKKIKGVKYDKETGEFSYTKKAMRMGTDQYIKARMSTEAGKQGVMRMIEHKDKFSVTVTSELVMMSYRKDNDGNKIYAVNKGETLPGCWIMVTTNEITTDELMKGNSNDKIKIFELKNNGQLKHKTIKRSQISGIKNDNSPFAKTYSKAKRESGFSDYEDIPANKYNTSEEKIHNTGAHEETHLFEGKVDLFKGEFDAFSKELEAAKDYDKNVEKKTEPTLEKNDSQKK